MSLLLLLEQQQETASGMIDANSLWSGSPVVGIQSNVRVDSVASMQQETINVGTTTAPRAELSIATSTVSSAGAISSVGAILTNPAIAIFASQVSGKGEAATGSPSVSVSVVEVGSSSVGVTGTTLAVTGSALPINASAGINQLGITTALDHRAGANFISEQVGIGVSSELISQTTSAISALQLAIGTSLNEAAIWQNVSLGVSAQGIAAFEAALIGQAGIAVTGTLFSGLAKFDAAPSNLVTSSAALIPSIRFELLSDAILTSETLIAESSFSTTPHLLLSGSIISESTLLGNAGVGVNGTLLLSSMLDATPAALVIGSGILIPVTNFSVVGEQLSTNLSLLLQGLLSVSPSIVDNTPYRVITVQVGDTSFVLHPYDRSVVVIVSDKTETKEA